MRVKEKERGTETNNTHKERDHPPPPPARRGVSWADHPSMWKARHEFRVSLGCAVSSEPVILSGGRRQ